MIKDNKKLSTYLNSVVSSVFKILPLYEEGNSGTKKYIDSLLFELYGLNKAVAIKNSFEYIALLATLESLKEEVVKEDSKHPVVKREIFKSIDIIKKMVEKLDGE